MLRLIIWQLGLAAFFLGVWHWHLLRELEYSAFLGVGMFWAVAGLAWVAKGLSPAHRSRPSADAGAMQDAARRAAAAASERP